MLKKLLLLPPPHSLASLTANLNISARTAARYFSDLVADCSDLFADEYFILIKKGGLITYKNSSTLSDYLILERLHIKYVQASLEFQVINALLLKRYTSVNALADDLFISPSNLYRLLYKLEPLVQKFGLSFALLDKENPINFYYEEKKQRLFSYFFYWSTLKGFHLDLTNIGNETINRIDQHICWQGMDNWLPSKKEQIRYICSITEVRLKIEQHELSIPLKEQQILLAFSQINDLSKIYAPFNELETNHPERLFLNFFFRITAIELDSTTQIINIVSLLKNIDNPYTKKSSTFIKSISDEFKLSLTAPEEAYFYYHFTLTLLFIFYGEIELPKEFKEIDDLKLFSKPKDPYDSSLLQQAQAFYRNSELSKYIPLPHQQTVIGIICLIIDIKPKPKLNIAIHYSQSVVGESLIQRKLLTLFNQEILEFTNDFTRADLVIADTYGSIKTIKRFYYMDSLTDPLKWDNLFEFIQTLLTDHFFKTD